MAPKRPQTKSQTETMPIQNDMKRFSRLTVEVDPILRASPGGAALSDADRKGMLREHRQGEPIELYADAIVYRQSKTLRPLPASKMGEANLNFVYFKPSGLKSLASSFKGRRVLADHNPSMAAVGGEIVSSELVDSGEWMEIHQTMRLSASWAVEAVLTKTLTAFSIGWATKSGSWRDAISCSVCRKKMHTSECGHFPGDQLDFDGADEKVVVESM